MIMLENLFACDNKFLIFNFIFLLHVIVILPRSARHSRVHITKTTLDYLGDKFEVEPGNGASREQYLADHKVESYLIVPPKVSEKEKKG
jgi:hypothetical protein